MRVPSLAFAVLLIAAALPACASGPPGSVFTNGSGWTEQSTEAHDALLPGVRIAWWTRGMGAAREHLGALRTPQGDVRPDDLAELRVYCRAPDAPAAARAYADLAQRLGIAGLPVVGHTLGPDTESAAPGGNGRYTRRDAEAWGIDFPGTVAAAAGGLAFDQVVLVAPRRHPDLEQFVSPWRVVLVHTVVYPDGAIAGEETRTLTNGDDAARFVTF